ncbi:HepT-like ribonuclease domain-containing protein [Flavobacterium soyangense]|uniref:DUF86 domain-containing protein n=1 Tax=Flavobacterium soyangense TaxID=2023265 RepID=A0A930XZB4_9FLAO|nr:DUF86 domain-containing protein [Flavobacterium soyangense]MBF2707254.1 DUF86 domain-containing protein [Flavobacterium soyangense]
MVKDKNIFRLQHVIDCIEKIEIITKDLSYGGYLEDWIKQDAIFRNIEIIGEAIANVEEELKKKYPDVPWVQAKGMRNFLIHEYFKVDHDAVWETYQNHLPKLKLQIISIINDIK